MIRPNSLEPIGDYLHSVDAARAILALAQAPQLRYRHYNVASGVAVSVGEIIGWAAEKVPGVRHEVSTGDAANVVQDPNLSGGMWGAYDIARLERDTAWRPRPAMVSTSIARPLTRSSPRSLPLSSRTSTARGSLVLSRGSWPAIAAYTRAQSSTLRVNGPI